MQCGAHQPAVAEVQPDGAPTPDDTSVATAVPPMDLDALEAQAAALVGEPVVFRSLSRRRRALRAEPNPDLPPLPDIVVGRCTAIEARGAWVLLAHSTGVRGWCPVTNVRIPRSWRDEPEDGTSSVPSAVPELAAVEALERLHALHADGGLTDDEFSQAKKSLLARGNA